MMKIIDGKRYNTDTAEHLADLPCTYFCSDFGHHDTAIYRTTRGAYFLAGSGHAASMWAEAAPGGGQGPGSGICVVSESDALKWLESAKADEVMEKYFSIEDA
jgi:hypothetical protein